MRNPDLQQKAKAEIEDEVDKYSEEEMGIAQDEAIDEEESQELKFKELKDVAALEEKSLGQKDSQKSQKKSQEEFEETPR